MEVAEPSYSTPVLISCVCTIVFTVFWVWLMTPPQYVPPQYVPPPPPPPTPVIPPSSLLAPGQIAYFAMIEAPPGWLVCDGTSYVTSAWPELFGAIGTTFGTGKNSVGDTTFNVPDLSGQFIRGFDRIGTVDRDRDGKGFGSRQNDMYAAHSHGGGMRDGGGEYKTNYSNGGDRSINRSSTDNAGGSETRPKNVALLPCIKV